MTSTTTGSFAMIKEKTTNQGLLNRLHLHDKITSAWFFNGHVFGTDEKGGRYKFDIYDNINEKIR
jgi:hypothetical protein